jgi:hypothetical protein
VLGGILWIHTSWDCNSGQEGCPSKGIGEAGPHDQGGSRWQDAGPRLGVAWSGNELGVQSKKEAGQEGGLHGLLNHGRPCWWGDWNGKGVSYRRGRWYCVVPSI